MVVISFSRVMAFPQLLLDYENLTFPVNSPTYIEQLVTWNVINYSVLFVKEP